MQKTRIRIYSLLVLLAFAVNMVMPFFAVYNVSAQETQHVRSVFGDKILICADGGFKWVKLADLQSGKETPKRHGGDECPLCYAAHHIVKLSPAAPTIFTPSFARYYAPDFAYDAALAPPHFTSAQRVRAPPVLS